MFAKPRTRHTIAPPSKKRKLVSAVEEVTFDATAREDYLNGFHKRKLQRIKHANEEAAKRERNEKLAARKLLREGRKADLEKHVEAMNSILREQNGIISDSSERESAVDAERWEGTAEEAPVDHKDEYVDDDRFTTITIEAVNVTKDGLHKAQQGEDDEEEVDVAEVDAPRRKRHETLTRPGTAPGSIKRSSDVEPSKGVKKKKQKFRYESKAERKVTRFKERSGNKMKAKARKTL